MEDMLLQSVKLLLQDLFAGSLALILRRNVTFIAVGFSRKNLSWAKVFLPGVRLIRLGNSRQISDFGWWFLGRMPLKFKVISYGYVPLLIRGNRIFERFSSRGMLLIFEDGFFRGTSVETDSPVASPLSIILDRKALHFDGSRVSELDDLLNSRILTSPSCIRPDAIKLFDRIRQIGLSKFIDRVQFSAGNVGELKENQRCIILGQVRTDQSLIWGRKNRLSFVELAQIAISENPGSEVVFRPHPLEILDPQEKNQLQSLGVLVSSATTPLGSELKTADKVYTFCSQAGFDALLAGKTVVTFGTPFYAGWGLTDDREEFEVGKRTRQLSLLELFCGAVLNYPLYRLLDGSTASAPEALQEQIRELREAH